MERAEIRRWCVEMAIKCGTPAEEVCRVAQSFFDFVTGGGTSRDATSQFTQEYIDLGCPNADDGFTAISRTSAA